MKAILIYLLLILQLVFSGSSVLAAANIPPAPTGTNIYVQDYAGVIDPQARASMNTIANELQRKTKAQLVVVTIKSLQGESLETYSLDMLRTWGIGDKTLNNGVLMLISVGDRKSRIEVGYGLEGALPDGLTGRIQDEYMLPFFRQNQYSKGIQNGFNALSQLIAKEYQVQVNTQPVVRPIVKQQQQAVELPGWVAMLLGVGFVGLMIIDQMFLGGTILRMLLYIIAMGRGGGGGYGGGRGGFGGGSGGGGGSSRSW